MYTHLGWCCGSFVSELSLMVSLKIATFFFPDKSVWVEKKLYDMIGKMQPNTISNINKRHGQIVLHFDL